MKKISLLLNVLLVSFILFQSFKSDHASSKPAVTDDSNPPAVFKGVDAILAKNMVENYKKRQWSTLAKYNNVNRFDSRAVWFSLGTIKEFIRVIESVRTNADSRGCYDSLGVRIYFTNYPILGRETWDTFPYLKNGVPRSHSNMHSLLMVPTYFDGTYNTDFDPKFVSGCKPVAISKVYDYLTRADMQNREITFLAPGDWTGSGGGLTVQNKGTGTPPPYDGEGMNVTADGKRWKRPCSGATFMDKCDGVICDTWYTAPAASNSNQP